MVQDAIRAYLESLIKDGQPIPRDKQLLLDPIKEQVHVALSV
jgi:predicted RNase H-like HicB family nuclease